MFATVAAIVSAIVTTAGIFMAWRASRESALRRGDVLTWANEVISVLQSLLLICIFEDTQLDAATIKEKLTDVIFNTSILTERGRLFFKNKPAGDYGREKESAYRGYRPAILDQILLAHQIARRWADADEDTRLHLKIIARVCARRFVSLVQQEVGRDRTASADAGMGGTGKNLDDFIRERRRRNREEFP